VSMSNIKSTATTLIQVAVDQKVVQVVNQVANQVVAAQRVEKVDQEVNREANQVGAAQRVEAVDQEVNREANQVGAVQRVEAVDQEVNREANQVIVDQRVEAVDQVVNQKADQAVIHQNTAIAVTVTASISKLILGILYQVQQLSHHHHISSTLKVPLTIMTAVSINMIPTTYIVSMGIILVHQVMVSVLRTNFLILRALMICNKLINLGSTSSDDSSREGKLFVISNRLYCHFILIYMIHDRISLIEKKW